MLPCADSRVPVEIVFDQTSATCSSCRVAGNITSPEIIASLEYGAAVLGSRLMMVLGHAACGAVRRHRGQGCPRADQRALRAHASGRGPGRPGLEAAIRANARIQAGIVRDASPVIADLAARKIKVVAAYYDLASGAVTLLP